MKMWRMASFLIMGFIGAAPVWAGTVSGKVTFSGTAPEAATIDMAADPACAALHTEPLKSEEVVVNADGTLKNVFVYIKTGLEGQTFTAPAEPVVIDQKGCHYVPHVTGVMVGQDVQLVNSDSTLHNVHAMPEKSKPFNLGMPIPNMKLKKKFDQPEVMVKMKCDVHPWMGAYVGVLPHPFYSVTGDAGTFEIKDLPAGTYTLEAWHEKYGVQTQQITVDASGSVTADIAFAG